MAKRNDAWGIELGADAIKAIRLTRTPDGVEVSDYEVLPFPQVLTTPDLNVEEAIQVNLDQLLAKHDLKKTPVVASVPGNMAFARFAKLPPVDPKKIPDIVRFEAVQQIPFPIDQVEWDYQVFQQEDSPDVEVGIFAITKDRLMSWLSHFRKANLTVDALTLSPLAVYNAYAYDLKMGPNDEGVILMDIGTSSTDVIIVEHGGIWLRTLPLGGNNFTEALVRAFKLSFPKADKLKREAATSKYARQIFQAMRPVFADLVQELQRSLGYYQSLNRDAKLVKLVGVGSTFKLPGLQKFLKQQLQMEVIRPDGFERVKVEGKDEADFADNAVRLGTAYGLALQGLGLGTVNANILPGFVLQQRVWRAKQPWFLGAAAVFAAAAGLGFYHLKSAQSAYAAAEASGQAQVQGVIGSAGRLAGEWQNVAQGADPRQRIENLRRILDYRDLWPKLMMDLSEAAAALGSQPELFTPDYEAIALVPREQQRRIYVKSMTTRYLTAPPAGAAPAAPVATPEAGPPADYFTQSQQPQTVVAAGDLAWSKGDGTGAVPRFEITLQGSTPFAQAVNLLADNYVKWLNDNAERGDRPYRLKLVGNPIQSISQVPASAAPADGGGGAPAAPAPMFNTGRPMPGGGGRPMPGGAGGGWGLQPVQGGEGVKLDTTVASLLPQRTVPATPQPGDWLFTISLTVELIKPEEARQREEGAAAPVPSSADAAAPANAPAPGPAPAPAPGLLAETTTP